MNLLKSTELPTAPIGERIMCRPDPPREESQIIVKPEDRKYLPNSGTVLSAGLGALDKLHDHGILIGDHVWWGKFAGVMEEWDHFDELTTAGGKCQHLWTRIPASRPNDRKWACDDCKSTRLSEHVLVMNVDDILADDDLQRRLDAGAMSYHRGKLATGQTKFYIERTERE